ncbi:MAG: phosphoadenosine phosphosulfate reductase family protein [Phycisphaerae bacterium]
MSRATVSERPAASTRAAPDPRGAYERLLGTFPQDGVTDLVGTLHFGEKVERSLALLAAAHREFGRHLVVASTLSTGVVWHLAKRAAPGVRGFVVVTRHMHRETLDFLGRIVARFPELTVYRNNDPLPEDLPRCDPDRCCELLKVEPARRAIRDLEALAWVTGVRATAGRRRAAARELELRPDGLVKINPVLLWHEHEVWKYAALYKVEVNPLYALGYRSLGCAPCTRIAAGDHERAGRWVGTSKCGGECGINTRPMKLVDGAGI